MAVAYPDTPRFQPPERMASLAAPGQSPYLDHWRERAGLPPAGPKTPTAGGSAALLSALIDSAFGPIQKDMRDEGAQAP